MRRLCDERFFVFPRRKISTPGRAPLGRQARGVWRNEEWHRSAGPHEVGHAARAQEQREACAAPAGESPSDIRSAIIFSGEKHVFIFCSIYPGQCVVSVFIVISPPRCSTFLMSYRAFGLVSVNPPACRRSMNFRCSRSPTLSAGWSRNEIQYDRQVYLIQDFELRVTFDPMKLVGLPFEPPGDGCCVSQLMTC